MLDLIASRQGPLARNLERLRPTMRYCMQTEAHVYALAIAASVLLSFYPFLIVMLTFCRGVLRWPAAVQAIYLALNDYLPGDVGDFVQRNLQYRSGVQIVSLLLLLFTANGVFEPLEVALNRIWGAKANRSYLKNQLVSLGLIFFCGGLALLSLFLTAMNQQWMSNWLGAHASIELVMNQILFKLAAVPISMLGLFVVYWLLPNRKIEPVRVVPVAIVVGLALEVLKYISLLVWPLLGQKLQREYGVFHNSVTILLWSFVAAMIVLAGAEWSVRRDAAMAEKPGSPQDRVS